MERPIQFRKSSNLYQHDHPHFVRLHLVTFRFGYHATARPQRIEVNVRPIIERPNYQGGYRRKGTMIELTRQMIDDMHSWYHDRPVQTTARDEIDAIHIYDSVIVLEKKRKTRPGFLNGSD